ncbi:hypothetical protein RFI_00106 [Reticulomyxa filosa]|uniref:Uncharacterized protein n=1 Tax=Reticulomyxa filosa TaxID=46433 RepID=X6PFH7_RETFI|nr:hypothetical protein RFI_00106 [Reticulomyxa filosa]|eukprot:ETO36956.1 hypothetical protein RFI_00106 [Reticulomyxa filosa]
MVQYLTYLFCIAALSCSIVAAQFSISSWKTTFINPQNSEHKIPTDIYFPAENQESGFPLMVFGHCSQCQMTWYDYQWQYLVPKGYVIAYLGSYEYLGNTYKFAIDQRYVLDAIRAENNNASSPLFQKVSNRAAAGTNYCKMIINFVDHKNRDFCILALCFLCRQRTKKKKKGGHSMGGGASFISGANLYINNQTFLYNYDSVITLSGCGNNEPEMDAALENVTVPIFLISGTSDCICPPNEFILFVSYAESYYTKIPDTTCKFMGIITNATHCQFAEIPEREAEACDTVEKDLCPLQHKPILNKTLEWDIVNYYMNLWLNTTLVSENSANGFAEIANSLQSDKANGKMATVDWNCGISP